MIDPVLSLQCRAVRMVPLVTFGVPVMTPAESPQDRRRPKMTDHILAILSARDGHGRWSGPDQDHARRSTCLPGHCTALAWPGGAVVAVVMAPVEGKNAKMTKSLSGSRTGPGGSRRDKGPLPLYSGVRRRPPKNILSLDVCVLRLSLLVP